LPIFLFALPAGALADIVDRRRILLAAMATMLLVAMAMGLVVLAGAMTPLLLLAFTFALGTGAAFIAPVWQAVVPGLVPRHQLQAGVALNSVGINISRAIGPALGGAVIVALGVAWPFLLNALSFAAVIIAVLWWRPTTLASSQLPAERFWSAIGTGLRFARASAPFKATLVRAVAFFAFASAYWALLPLIARQQLGGGPELYGLLLGSAGAGAVGGALLLPALKARLGADKLVGLGTIGMAVALVVFAFAGDAAATIAASGLAIAASGLAGVAWIAVLSNLSVAAQMALPEWVRARGLSVFITVFFGAMTLGSVLWGQVAATFGIPVSLLAAAAGAVLGVVTVRRFKLEKHAGLDHSPSMHWPAPLLAGAVEHDRGPVMITVDYRIDPGQAAAFLQTLGRLGDARRRDGAFAWGVFEDVAEPGRYLEYFLEDSWLAHLRHHERVSQDDRALQQRVRAFQRAGAAPAVSHFLAPARAGEASVSAPPEKGLLK
ncbi:MAG: MFS transporter, partial [Hyphomicrobiales bacterium]